MVGWLFSLRLFCGEVREKNSPKIRNTHKSIVSTPVVSEEKRDEQ